MTTEWDLKHLYNSDEEWYKDIEELKNRMEMLTKLTESFLKDYDSFKKYIKIKMQTYQLIEKLYCYPRRHLDLDATDEKHQAMFNEILKIYGDYENLNNKFENSIINNDGFVMKFLSNLELTRYKRYFDLIIGRKKHIVTEKEAGNAYEEFAKTTSSLKKEYQRVFNEDVKFNSVIIDDTEEVVDRNTYNKLIMSLKQEDRKAVFDAYTEAYQSVAEQLKDLLISKYDNDIKIAKLENYSSLLEKKLYELELNPNIVETLIQKVNENLSVMHDYIDFKKRITNLNEFHIYDSSISICEASDKEYELEEAVTIIKESLKVLGDDYVALIDEMFGNGWVDVYPRDKKRTMSFSCISHCGVPYILVNYKKTIDSIRSLGHEIGHSAHTYYSKQNNDFVNWEFSLFLTEIVSKVNEILIFEYMLASCQNKEEQKYILDSMIGNIGNSLYGQILLTEFEHYVINKLEAGISLSEEELNNAYYQIYKKYNGESMMYDDNIKYGWAKIPHFIMQETYYMYQYAVGIAVATDIASKILSKDAEYIKKYRNFLALGNSVSIEEALKTIDINLQDSQYIENAINVMQNNIKRIKKLCD